VPNVPLQRIVEYLDRYLQISEVPDEPNAVNGLQVQNGSGSINRIVAAVDASLATIQGVTTGAAAAPPDHPFLLVHHGLFWEGNIPLTDRRYLRVKELFAHDIALYSAHIPLDRHPEVGNNAVLARTLGLGTVESFDTYRGVSLGVCGSLPTPMAREDFVALVEQLLGTHARLIPGGPPRVHRIGIITGAAGGRIAAARNAGLDTYLTGEGAHHTFFDAMELGVNVIYAGHYATETVGVKALAAQLGESFALPWEFHDHPTGL
jgi:dinuclear metal center YbgI/SA1388 family protein